MPKRFDDILDLRERDQIDGSGDDLHEPHINKSRRSGVFNPVSKGVLGEFIDNLRDTQFLPTGTVQEAKRQAHIGLTLALVIFSLFAFGALYSYDPFDPSLNTASSREDLSNWFGSIGATFADLTLQSFGYLAWCLPFVGLSWVIFVCIKGRTRWFGWRVALLPFALFMLASVFVFFDIGTNWHKPNSAGGAGGLITLALGQSLTRLPEWLVAGFFCVLGLCALFISSALPRSTLRIFSWCSLVFSAAYSAWRTHRDGSLSTSHNVLDGQDPVFVEPSLNYEGQAAFHADSPDHEDESYYAEDGAELADMPLEAPYGPDISLNLQIQERWSEFDEIANEREVVVESEEEQGWQHFELPSEVNLTDLNLNVSYGQLPPTTGLEPEEEYDDDLEDDHLVMEQYEPEPEPELDSEEIFDDEYGSIDLQLDLDEPVAATPAEKIQKKSKPAPAAPNKPARPQQKVRRYQAPSLDFLTKPSPAEAAIRQTREELEENAEILTSVLSDFGVKGQITNVRPGPVVTLYELQPAPGTKTSRVVNLADDIARSMSAFSARIATVPGRNVIGIELPNPTREMVLFREMLESPSYKRLSAKLPIALGKDIGGAPVYVDLAKMPHLLVAGTTGSGKSVAVNTMILSLLFSQSPERCKFIMIDPKMLELSVYDGIPHLLSPVVTDPKKAVVALNWAVREMEERYKLMSNIGVRNLDGFNKRLDTARKQGEILKRKVQTGFDVDTGAPVYEEQEISLDPLPFIVVIIDEMADLMLVAGKDIEGALQRLAQMARAAGIHIVMATQRPSVDVITGTIKANFPTRISFHVTSKIDSRTILGEMGAEQLLGQGDMLYMPNGGRIQRVHGPFASDDEVELVVNHLKELGEPEYVEAITAEVEEMESDPAAKQKPTGDDLYDQAVAVVLREKKASTSFVQRHLQIGYNRAARLIEQMEAEGLITPADRVGRRQILASNQGEDVL